MKTVKAGNIQTNSSAEGLSYIISLQLTNSGWHNSGFHMVASEWLQKARNLRAAGVLQITPRPMAGCIRGANSFGTTRQAQRVQVKTVTLRL